MKKTLLPLSFLLLSLTLIKPVISCAQVTGLTTAIYDSSYTTCQMPSSQFISATCNVVGTGTVVTTDVITMYVNFGDGSDTTLVATPNLGGSFVYFPCNHVYTTPGNYSPHISATDMYGNSSSSSCGRMYLRMTVVPLAEPFIMISTQIVFMTQEILLSVIPTYSR